MAVVLAVGGSTAASVIVPMSESPAFAAKAKSANNRSKPQRSTVRQTTGFEHQQCTVQDPCSSRNFH
jgi:hypothetical protein